MSKRLTAGAYARLRRHVVERDGGRCVLCLQNGTDVHHVIYRSQGGTDSLNNLVLLCRHCHERAHGTGNGKQSQKDIKNALQEYLTEQG